MERRSPFLLNNGMTNTTLLMPTLLAGLLLSPRGAAAAEEPSPARAYEAARGAYEGRCAAAADEEVCPGLKAQAQEAAREAIKGQCEALGFEGCVAAIADYGALLDPEERERLRAALKKGRREAKPEAAAEAPMSAGLEDGLTVVRDAVSGSRPGALDGLYDNAAARSGAAGAPAVIFVGAAPAAVERGPAGDTGRLSPTRAPVPAPPSRELTMSAREPSMSERAWSLTKEGGLRLLHSAGSVLALPFEAVGSGIQLGAGAAAAAVGGLERLGGAAAESGGEGFEWVGRQLRAPRLAAAGAWARRSGAELSETGSLTAGEGVALVMGVPARVVNAAARPVTALLAPTAEVLSTKAGLYGDVAAAAVDFVSDRRYQDLGASGRAVAGRGQTTDAMLNAKIEQASGFSDASWRYGGYGLALFASASDKAAQVLAGGPLAKEIGGKALHWLGLGAMAAGTAEQGVQHYAEYRKETTPRGKEAAGVKAAKSALDLGVLLAAGKADPEQGSEAPAPASPAPAPASPASTAMRGFLDRAASWMKGPREASPLEAKAERLGESALAGAEGDAAEAGGRRPMTPREETMRALLTASLEGQLEDPAFAALVDRTLAGETSLAMDPKVRARLEAGERPSAVLADVLRQAAADGNGDIFRFEDLPDRQLAVKRFADDAVVNNGRHSGERSFDHLPVTFHEFVHRLGFGEMKAHELQAALFKAYEARRLEAGLSNDLRPAAGRPPENGVLRAATDGMARQTDGAGELGMMRYLEQTGYKEEALLRHPEDRLAYMNAKLLETGSVDPILATRFPGEALAVLAHQRARLGTDPAWAKEREAYSSQIRALTREFVSSERAPSAEDLRAYRDYQERFKAGSDETLTPELGRTIAWLMRHPEFRTDLEAKAGPGRGSDAAGRAAAAKRSIAEAVRDLLGGGEASDPARALTKLEDVGELPTAPQERARSLADFAKGLLGGDGDLEVRAPGTAPLSGEEVFILSRDGAPAAVAKVYRSGRAADALAKELSAAEAVGALSGANVRPVGTIGAFRAGPKELVQFMEPAPGQDVYAVLRSVGQANGAEVRGRALAEAADGVGQVARAMGELHRRGAGERPGASNAAYDVDSARRMLGGLSGKIPDDLEAGLRARLDALAPAVLDPQVPGALTHGDAHPGNFFVGEDGVTMIDLETVMHSVGGVGNPAADVGRFTGAIRLNNASKGLNLTQKEIATLEKSFLAEYAKESGIAPEALAREAEFYRVRLGLTAMTHDPANLPNYVAALRKMLARRGGEGR